MCCISANASFYIQGIQITATTPTSNAVRFETGKVALELSNTSQLVSKDFDIGKYPIVSNWCTLHSAMYHSDWFPLCYYFTYFVHFCQVSMQLFTLSCVFPAFFQFYLFCLSLPYMPSVIYSKLHFLRVISILPIFFIISRWTFSYIPYITSLKLHIFRSS